MAGTRTFKTHRLLALLIGTLSCLAVPAMASEHFFDYMGSEWCADCHVDMYSGWLGTAHPHMLAPPGEASGRKLPLPAGHSLADISYVVGGSNWIALYLDENGYFVTSINDRVGNPSVGENQWNVLTGAWSDYRAGETGIPYDCGACHTTGWKADTDAATDGDLSDNQDGLPGIHGTFALGGVQCEACHGPGFTMVVDETAAFCGTCHSRDDVRKVYASDGFVLHQQQYNEFLASPHAERTCITCHDPHQAGEDSIQRTCESCHGTQAASYEGTKMFLAGVECVDCHMPRASKFDEPIGPFEAQVRTHLFRIRTDLDDQRMFTPDGSLVRNDSTGLAMVNLDFACKSCHAGQSTAWLASYAEDFHDQSFGITAAMSGTWWAGPDRSGEGWLLDAAANAFVASLYTYDAAGNQAWLLGAGEPEGDMVTVALEITDGAKFGSAFDPADVNRTPWGTAGFLFVSCTEATVELLPNAEMVARGFEAITVNLTRLTSSAISCPGP